MEKRISLIAFASAGLMLLASGCDKKEDNAQKAAQETPKTAQNQLQQSQNAANQVSGSAVKKPGVVVPAKTLVTFLPTISGYTLQGEAETVEMEMQGAKYSTATGTFHNGDKAIGVTIADYNYIESLSASYAAMPKMSVETNDESFKTDKFSGFPGWISWKKKDNDGSVVVVINDRVYVVVDVSNGVTLDELMSVAKSINYSGIASATAAGK